MRSAAPPRPRRGGRRPCDSGPERPSARRQADGRLLTVSGCRRADHGVRQAARMTVSARGQMTNRCPAPLPAGMTNLSGCLRPASHPCCGGRRPCDLGAESVHPRRGAAGRAGAPASWSTNSRSPAPAGGRFPTCAKRRAWRWRHSHGARRARRRRPLITARRHCCPRGRTGLAGGQALAAGGQGACTQGPDPTPKS